MAGEPDTVTIRQVQEMDREALARFFEENDKPEVTKYFHPFPLNDKTASDITGAEQLDHYYVGLKGKSIVGFYMLRGWGEGYAIPSFGVFVDYRYHRRGLGRQFTEHAVAEARRFNCPAVRLSVYESNVSAVRLYNSLGFQEIKREPTLESGVPDTKIVMMKELR
jgi:ribosomal protein S18 acetylase RimI-like enzyme